MSSSQGSDQQSLSLTTGGVTLLGVMLSIGITVGFGIKDDWWIRVLAGVGATVALVLIVKAGSKAGRGPIAKLANWAIDAPSPGDEDSSRSG